MKFLYLLAFLLVSPVVADESRAVLPGQQGYTQNRLAGNLKAVNYYYRQAKRSKALTYFGICRLNANGDFNDVLLETNGGMDNYKKMAALYQLAIFNPVFVLAKNNQFKPLLAKNQVKIIACRQPQLFFERDVSVLMRRCLAPASNNTGNVLLKRPEINFIRCSDFIAA